MATATKKGFFYNEYEDSMEVYSPYCGSCFRIPKNEMSSVKRWMNDIGEDFHERYDQLLGHCASKSPSTVNVADSCDYYAGHISMINWMVTTRCNFRCRYCYGQTFTKDADVDIEKVSDIILSYSPIAVVLMGGEPFVNRRYREFVSALKGKTGIILDTNGSLLKKDDIDFLKEANVLVRISLDSVNPDINEKGRISDMKDMTASVMRTIESCVNAGLNTMVHTVVSSYNEGDLLSLKDYLLKIGVRNWKLIQLANVKRDNTGIFPRNDTGEFLSNSYFDEVRKSTEGLRVTLQKNDSGQYDRSLILVAPNGDFYTRTKEGNVPIDPSNMKHPDLTDGRLLNHRTHAERYIMDI